MDNKLRDILTRRRPSGTKSESKFVSCYVDTIKGIQRDRFGNRILHNANSRTIISVHTDTVHATGGRQAIEVSEHNIVSLASQHSNCLGADDGAGVYAALRLIDAGVQATFIFHRSEEIGGLGSDWIAKNMADYIRQYDHCIALDRRGTSDIITRQLGRRCCSDEFAIALAAQLDLGHKPATGSFTDSANYMDDIPECSNISIGYAMEHTCHETLDLVYLESLITALCEVDFGSLPVSRNPNESEYLDNLLNFHNYGQSHGQNCYCNECMCEFETDLDARYAARLGKTYVL
jgi:hypothetical protein